MRSPGFAPRISRSRSRVTNGCGASTKKRCPYGQAEGFLRHQRAAPTTAAPAPSSNPFSFTSRPAEADAVLARGAAHEHDLGEVEGDVAVLGGEVVPALSLLDGLAKVRDLLR